MKDNSIRNRIIAFVLFICSFVIFSSQGMLPKSISLKLPGWMQNYNSNLIATGYDAEDRKTYETENNVIKKGTFDKLDLFSSANAYNGYVFNNKNNLFYFYGKNYDGNYLARFSTKKMDWKTAIYNDGFTNGTALRCGNKYYIYEGAGWFKVIYSKSMSIDVKASYDNYLTNDKTTDYAVISDLLQKQSESAINLSEFCLLLNEYFSKSLLGWYPNSDTAIFKKVIDDEVYLIKYNTKTLKNETFGPYKNKDHIYSTDEDTILYFNNDEGCINSMNITDGSINPLIYDLKSNISLFNFRTSDDDLTIAFITADNTLYFTNSLNAKKDSLAEKTKNDTVTNLLLTDENVYIYTKNAELSWWKLEG